MQGGFLLENCNCGRGQGAPRRAGAQEHHHHLMKFEGFHNKPVRRCSWARKLIQVGGSTTHADPGMGNHGLWESWGLRAPQSTSSSFSFNISTDSVCSSGSGPGLTRILTEGSEGPATASSVPSSDFPGAGGGELRAGGSGGSWDSEGSWGFLGSGGSWGSGWSGAPEPSPPASCELLA